MKLSHSLMVGLMFIFGVRRQSEAATALWFGVPRLRGLAHQSSFA
jgi:hypothetical protein